MPVTLLRGASAVELHLEVSEDLATARVDGLLWRCELIVSLSSLTHTDEFELVWNGHLVPAQDIRKADWVFQMKPSGVPSAAAGFRGYRLHLDLKVCAIFNVGKCVFVRKLLCVDGVDANVDANQCC